MGSTAYKSDVEMTPPKGNLLRGVQAKGVRDVEVIVVEGDPVRTIVDTAKARDIDMIVIGSRGRGDLEGLLLGSVSHMVVQLAPCTCVVVRQTKPGVAR